MKNKIMPSVFILGVVLMMVQCGKDSMCSNSQAPFITEANCATPFIDPRDGQAYCTVTIGNQVWMTENMRYDTPDTIYKGWDLVPNECHNYIDGTSCTPSDYHPIYGRYYNWYSARYACPPSWHLPTASDWEALESYIGGRSTAAPLLKSTQYWTNPSLDCKTPGTSAYNGIDSFNFNAYPAGLIVFDATYTNIVALGTLALFHSSDVHELRTLSYLSSGIIATQGGGGHACRCIKD